MKTRIFFIVACFAFGLQSCEDDDPTIPPVVSPSVTSEASFTVLKDEAITYATGLSHDSLNSASSTTIPLKLDVYYPDNNEAQRPAILLIHGGGFVGGDRTAISMVNIAQYFASRGFVAASIDYRKLGDVGTIPQEWITFANQFVAPSLHNDFYKLYPAHRDAKAAVRWFMANANNYNINPNYLTVGGGSAGAVTSITIGISDLDDYTTEISETVDPTLTSTNLNQTYEVKTILDFWGSKVAIDVLEVLYNKNPYGPHNPSLFIVHGTEDPTVLYSEALALDSIYTATGAPHVLHTLQGRGHGPWTATIDGKSLEQTAFEYVVEQQGLILQ
ncbi:MAG: alpha/beta hydrolase [Schleiferiaceae bacterium]